MKKVKVSKRPTVKEFTELKNAYWDMRNSAVDKTRELMDANKIERLLKTISRYEIFVITVIALVAMHVALVAVHSG